MVGQQMVSFNKPYQIGTFGHKVKDGYQNEYDIKQLQEQDLIVVGSDGLWDNMKLDRIHYEVIGPNSIDKVSKKKKSLQ